MWESRVCGCLGRLGGSCVGIPKQGFWVWWCFPLPSRELEAAWEAATGGGSSLQGGPGGIWGGLL